MGFSSNNSSFLTGYASVDEPTCSKNINYESSECNPVGILLQITQPYNTAVGYMASTTTNISGVYDMSGGAWEYVMGYNAKVSTVGDASNINSLYSDFFTNSKWSNYYDKYSNTNDTVYTNRILGDATGEMGPFALEKNPDNTSSFRTSWYGDYALFVSTDLPWFRRSPAWFNGVATGIFAFSRGNGKENGTDSYRVVLAPSK